MDLKLQTPEGLVSKAEDVIVQAQSAATNDTCGDAESEIKSEQTPNRVDFSEEEAQLAADAPEYDLGEEPQEAETAVAESSKEYSSKTKQELLDEFAGIIASRPVQSLRKDIDAIKIAFYKLHRVEVEHAKQAFVEQGGDVAEFMPPTDTAETRFKELFAEYRVKRDSFIASQEQQKEKNLVVKQQIIEELKELINSGETLNTTFNAFRDLQSRWKDTGLVPQANVKDLWETYNLHVENFYNIIKINKELRDLDLKRNFEAKTVLCEQAEELTLDSSVINAFHRLQKLHEQWRELGPVANEFKETLWERFKEASSRINKQHQEHFEGLKDEQHKNFELKTELCLRVEELAAGVFTNRKEWNKASDQVVEIQKVWKTIGFAPKKDNTRVYERFRNACDKVFEAKRGFYLQAKGEMDENMRLKSEICLLAESLQNSEDWKTTTEELIELQRRWKETGPVSRRYSDSIWKRFRAACDNFFERKSAHFSVKDHDQERNLELKLALLAEIEALNTEEYTFDKIKEYQRRWSEIGFVTIKQKDKIHGQYKAVMDKLFAAVRGGERDRRMDNFKGKIDTMRKGGGGGRVKSERDRLYGKVRQQEADIALLENNIGFFAKSKNAESLIRDIQDKIAKAKQEMAATIEMVKMIDKGEQSE